MTACATAGVVRGIVGPFGSFFNGGLVSRVAYWTSVLMVSGIIFILALR